MKTLLNILAVTTSIGLLASIFIWVDPEIVANVLFVNSYLPAIVVIALVSLQITYLLTSSLAKSLCYLFLLIINIYLLIWKIWNPIYLLMSVSVGVGCWWLSKSRSDKVDRHITSNSESGGKDENTREN